MITAANARELQLKGVKVRLQRAKDRKLLAQVKAYTAVNGDLTGVTAELSFRNQVANRVRNQIHAIQAKIDDQLNKPALDSKVLKELTEALARLETIEQKLSGRASPGALRPRSEKSSRSRPSEPEPMPEDGEPGPENG